MNFTSQTSYLTLEQSLRNCGLRAKSSPHLTINRDLWELSHTYWFVYCLWQPSHSRGRDK